MIDTYQPPKPSFIPVVNRAGRLLFKFDPQRGLIEIQDRGEKEIVDLAILIANAEQKQSVTNN